MTGTESLMEILQEHLASEQLELPVFPPLALQLQEMLSRDDADIAKVSARIAEDQVLASQLLRAANSAFFSGLSKVTTIRDSIMRLGSKQAINLIFLATQHQQYKSMDRSMEGYLRKLWTHASSCATGGKWLAEKLGYSSIAQEAFLGGLFHDIGNLFLLKVLENIRKTRKGDFDLSAPILTEVLESMHTTQGALLLQRWNIPEIYCDVVRLHHDEQINTGNTMLVIVRLVDQACHKLGIGLHHNPAIVLAATPEAQILEVSELLAAQLEIMLEDSVG